MLIVFLRNISPPVLILNQVNQVHKLPPTFKVIVITIL
jgi:hypothetical protein